MNTWSFEIAGRVVPLLVLLTAAWSCTPRPAPERAVIQYVELVRAGQCNDAFHPLSTRLRDALQAEARAREEERSLLFDPPAPIESLYCNAGPFERVKLRRTRSAIVRDDLADVRLIEAQPAGHLVPGFWPTRVEYVDMLMRAVVDLERSQQTRRDRSSRSAARERRR